MRAVEAFSLRNQPAGTYPFTLTGGKYLLEAVANWNSGSLALKQIGPDGVTAMPVYVLIPSSSATPPSSTATNSALGTAISDEPSTTATAAAMAQLVTDGATPTQGHVTTLNSDWGTLKTAIDTWVAAVGTFESDWAAFLLALKTFNVSTSAMVADVAALVIPSYTAFAADVATLVADGATPTQGHVNTANTAWGTLLTAINLLVTDLGTTNTDWGTLKTAISALTPAMASLVTNGYGYIKLPAGHYQLVYATGSALYASVVRIPVGE